MKKRDWKMLPAVIAILAIGLFFTGCGGNGEQEQGFVPVTAISGLPTTAPFGEYFELTGIVVPTYATNRTPINWTIAEDIWLIDAEINGNILTSDFPGPVRIRATIPNGRAADTDFYYEFEIEIKVYPSIPPESGTGTDIPSAAVLTAAGLTQPEFEAIRNTVTGGTFSWEFFFQWGQYNLRMNWTNADKQDFEDIADLLDTALGTNINIAPHWLFSGKYEGSYWCSVNDFVVQGDIVTVNYAGGEFTIGDMEWELSWQ